MLEAIRNRMKDREQGFTLIELMVVVLIIAILVAIAIPTFLGARTRAQDKAAQSDLRNALTAAKTIYVDTEDYSAMTATDLAGVEPSLSFVSGAGNGSKTQVGWTGAAAGQVVFTKQSASGKFFCISEDVAVGTKYNSNSAVASVDTVAECNAASW